MAHTAWVGADLACPACDAVVTDLVWMTWGGVRSPDANVGPIYRIGDALLWFVDDTATAHADSSYGYRATNVGDPTANHVDVIDVYNGPYRCPGCKAALGPALTEIRDGRIHAVRVTRLGEVHPDLTEIIYADPEGTTVVTAFTFGSAVPLADRSGGSGDRHGA